jgi:hypothetical protein
MDTNQLRPILAVHKRMLTFFASPARSYYFDAIFFAKSHQCTRTRPKLLSKGRKLNVTFLELKE